MIGTLFTVLIKENSVQKGPIFTNLLADEQLAPAKVQSALLEGMQERQVTIGEKTFRFLVLFCNNAENPIDQEGLPIT